MENPGLKNKDAKFTAGVILLVLGYLICLMPYWWIFGTPLIFVAGFVLMWISKAKLTTKLLFTITPIILWIPGFFALMYFGTNHVKPAIYLIPNNFRGKIIVYYGEPCGIKIPEVDGRYIFKVPANGVVIVKNPLETGIINEDYYFADANYKKIKKIDLLDQQDFNEDFTLEKNKHEPSRKKVAAFLGGTGSGESVNTGKRRYSFNFMYITSWDSLKNSNDSITDSISLTLLNNCRTHH